MIRAAGYCRVSTDHTDQANSFEAQQRYFRECIGRQEGWELYEIYADEGITGTSVKKRVRFNDMIRDARRGCFSLILTKEVSRFSRNILDTIAYTRELRNLGVEVIFLTDGIRTMDPDAELRLSIMASIAQEESRKTSARVKWGQTRQMERGVVFGHSLLGYTVKNGGISVEPEGAETVRLIFRKYVQEKKGTSVIARELAETGWKTGGGSLNWTAGYVLKVLKNEKYAGDLIQKKTCTPDCLTHQKKINRGMEEPVILRDHHEPIVSRELWNAAQLEIAKRNPGSERHSVRYALSGKIRCGECGAPFVSRVKKRRDGTSYRRWGCASAAEKNGCTVGRMLRDDHAMEMLRTVMQSLVFSRETLLREADDGRGPDEERSRLQTALESVRLKRDRAVDGYLSGIITGEELDRMRRRYDAQIRDTEQRLSHCAEESPDSLRKRAEEILAGRTDCCGFWQNLVDEIRVYRDGRVTVRLKELETVWIFSQDGQENGQIPCI